MYWHNVHWYTHGSMLLYVMWPTENIAACTGTSCRRKSSMWLQLVQGCYCRVPVFSRFGTCKRSYKIGNIVGESATLRNTWTKYYKHFNSSYLYHSDMRFSNVIYSLRHSWISWVAAKENKTDNTDNNWQQPKNKRQKKKTKKTMTTQH